MDGRFGPHRNPVGEAARTNAWVEAMTKRVSAWMRQKRRISALERLWARTDTSGECWIWRGGKGSMGYGKISRRGKTIGTHQLSWELARGTIPKGLSILHRCDVPLCVRPTHLFLGTQRDNMRDMVRKGRDRFGENNSHSVLTEPAVREIRRMLASGKNRGEVAMVFNVSRSTVEAIAAGKTWAHVK